MKSCYKSIRIVLTCTVVVLLLCRLCSCLPPKYVAPDNSKTTSINNNIIITNNNHSNNTIRNINTKPSHYHTNYTSTTITTSNSGSNSNSDSSSNNNTTSNINTISHNNHNNTIRQFHHHHRKGYNEDDDHNINNSSTITTINNNIIIHNNNINNNNNNKHNNASQSISHDTRSVEHDKPSSSSSSSLALSLSSSSSSSRSSPKFTSSSSSSSAASSSSSSSAASSSSPSQTPHNPQTITKDDEAVATTEVRTGPRAALTFSPTTTTTITYPTVTRSPGAAIVVTSMGLIPDNPVDSTGTEPTITITTNNNNKNTTTTINNNNIIPTTINNNKRQERMVDLALLKAVKNDLLQNLGLRKVPDVSRINQTVEEKRTKIRLFREHLIARHRLHDHYDVAEFTNDMSHSFHCSDFERENKEFQATTDPVNNPNLVFAMKIQHPGDPLMETVVRSAKLHIFKRDGNIDGNRDDNYDHGHHDSSSNDTTRLEVNVYHVTPDMNTSDTKRTIVDTKFIDINYSGWVVFDIRQAIQNWLDGPINRGGLLRLQLSSKACTKDLRRIFRVNRLRKRSLRDQGPRLNVKTSERQILGRVKRDLHTGDCVKGDGETQCCRFALKVNFTDIKWDDWVIAPSAFDAYYCKGECGNSRLANDWSLIKRLIHKKDPERMPIDVCCVPNKYKGLSLLHYNNAGQLTLSERDRMVVEDCRCR